MAKEKCKHKNKARTFLGKLDVIECMMDKGHEGYHRGFAKVLGKPVSDAAKYPGLESVEENGIVYLVDEELISWDDACGDDLKYNFLGQFMRR